MESYETGRGDLTNPVLITAQAYLDAAEIIFKNECAKIGFLELPNWFVVHHLSVIATELFLKSLRVIISHPPVRDESGPDFELIEHAYKGHHAQLVKLYTNEGKAIRIHLTKDQNKLIDWISTPDNARNEIARGRYPYESIEGEDRFPSGDDAHKIAVEWLSIARSLSEYSKTA